MLRKSDRKWLFFIWELLACWGEARLTSVHLTGEDWGWGWGPSHLLHHRPAQLCLVWWLTVVLTGNDTETAVPCWPCWLCWPHSSLHHSDLSLLSQPLSAQLISATALPATAQPSPTYQGLPGRLTVIITVITTDYQENWKYCLNNYSLNHWLRSCRINVKFEILMTIGHAGGNISRSLINYK